MSLRASLALLLLLPACLAEKDDTKGVVDDSAPPSIPGESGKADDPAHEVALRVESPHPYANNLDRVFHVDLVAALPACVQQARVHFSILRTEANYDYVDLESGGAIIASYDGTHDNTWSPWFDVAATGLDVRLSTDGSVTRHGFVIDKVEWAGGAPRCPPLVGCPAGTVSILMPSGACTCPDQPVCVAFDDIQIDHVSRRRFLHAGKRTVGTAASTLSTGPADGTEVLPVGTVSAEELESVLTLAQANGVLFGEAYDRPLTGEGFLEILNLRVGDIEIGYMAPQGTHTPEVAAVISAFEALFVCGAADAAITCGSDMACIDYACQPENTCVCAEIYQPVCGIDGRTYGNACSAGCADMPVNHPGECGQVGDTCGGLLGQTCVEGNKCRYGTSAFEAPFPDAAGACVARTYCDAPADCNGLPAPAVLGSWACEANSCAFRAGPNWRAVTGFRFATPHPYANSTSVWKELYLPAEAQALRLVVNGTFKLENNYDFLEVWAWQSNAWTRVRRYTGTTAPALTDTFPGRYFYLKFVSDASVTDQGFDVTAQYR